MPPAPGSIAETLNLHEAAGRRQWSRCGELRLSSMSSRVPSDRVSPVALSNADQLARYPLAGGCRDAGVHRGVAEAETPVLGERKVDERVECGQIRRGDLLTTLDQDVGEERFGCGIGVAARRERRLESCRR